MSDTTFNYQDLYHVGVRTSNIDKAMEEIESGRGRLYDASVVDACLHLFRNQGYEIPG